MMETANKFDAISVACRSRLLFRTEAEYRDAMGVSLETVANNRESARDMDMYFGILSAESAKVVDKSFGEIVEAYTEASEMYLSMDWGDRSQLASRRKFCRMLFRLYATAGRELTNEEIFKFKIKNDDARLLREFFPNGTDELPCVDVRLIALFAFGVLRPFTENSRGRDIRDKETIASLENLRTLIGVLREDIPRLGSTEKPLVFDECLAIVDSFLSDGDELDVCTPLWMYGLMMNISHACRSLTDAERLRLEGERLCALYLDGIWVDDADRGRTRFWIFPYNIMLCFCYEYDGMTWKLSPYEFKVRFAENPEFKDTFIFVAPTGNLNYILSPEKVMEPDQFATGLIEGTANEATGEINRLTFEDEPRAFPEWFAWRSWERLDCGDERYRRFRAVLSDIYNPKSPASIFFRNTAPELIDRINNMIGRDNRYLYVYDWQPRRFVIQEREPDTFAYEVAPGEEFPAESLFEIEVSEEHPLYAIPVEMERRNYGSLELNKFVDMFTDVENIREIYVVYSDRTPLPRLGFPAYSLTVGIDMNILSKMGIKKFTRRP